MSSLWFIITCAIYLLNSAVPDLSQIEGELYAEGVPVYRIAGSMDQRQITIHGTSILRANPAQDATDSPGPEGLRNDDQHTSVLLGRIEGSRRYSHIFTVFQNTPGVSSLEQAMSLVTTGVPSLTGEDSEYRSAEGPITRDPSLAPIQTLSPGQSPTSSQSLTQPQGGEQDLVQPGISVSISDLSEVLIQLPPNGPSSGASSSPDTSGDPPETLRITYRGQPLFITREPAGIRVVLPGNGLGVFLTSRKP
ncbi:hypothetical protein [Spirochaeta lutea]|uniref:Uncharacterized protein n=1 Tax=Spirochaeta lutea TaxID=1480694 RepID=A0A098QT09_9SPIO|nr:hypothetical protein [Spirochaeta lutea]KGE70706.1 hypothetical protein DC28_14455 [Spirochaeta lutea]